MKLNDSLHFHTNSSPVEANNSKSVPFGPAKSTVEEEKLKQYRSLVEANIQFPPFYRPSTALTFIMKFLVLILYWVTFANNLPLIKNAVLTKFKFQMYAKA